MANSCAILWFLPCFFITLVIMKGITMILDRYVCRDRTKNLILMIFSILFFVIAQNLSTHFKSNNILEIYGYPFSINVAFYGLTFMIFGHLLANIFKLSSFEKHRSPTILAAFVLITISLFTHQLNLPLANDGTMHIDMRSATIGNPIWFIFNSTIVSAAIILFSRLISILFKKEFLLSYLGKNSLVVMCLHSTIYGIALALSLRIGYMDEILSNQMIMTAFIIVTLCPICYIVNKYFPLLAGR